MSYFDDNEDRIIYGIRRRGPASEVFCPPMCRDCGIPIFFDAAGTMFSDPMCTERHHHHAEHEDTDFEDLT